MQTCTPRSLAEQGSWLCSVNYGISVPFSWFEDCWAMQLSGVVTLLISQDEETLSTASGAVPQLLCLSREGGLLQATLSFPVSPVRRGWEQP